MGWNDIVQKTSSEMQGEVVNALHAAWITKLKYFNGIDKETGLPWTVDTDFKLKLALEMRTSLVAPMAGLHHPVHLSCIIPSIYPVLSCVCGYLVCMIQHDNTE